MTKAEFKKQMEVYGDCFYETTCPKLQAEIVRKIMNNKATDDFCKMSMLHQYMKNLTTNDCVVENIKRLNNQ